MKAKLFLFVSVFLFLFLLLFILFKVEVKPDGDIVEYYGVTETILNHGSLDLRQDDINKLLKYIDSPKFANPGYYLYGRDNNRYPVHFWAYSLLLIPARLGLQAFNFNPLLSLPLTNLVILAVALGFIFHRFIKSENQRWRFLAVLLFSPLIFYFTWPGPDMLYLSLLLVAVFYAFNKHYLKASWLTALASWHSQPLIVLVILFGLIALIKSRKLKTVGLVLVPGFLAVVPYVYNLYAFNTLTPWLGLQNAYTAINGFGLKNLSLKKLYEQFFDLNIGLFWYSPLLMYLNLLFFIKQLKQRQWEILAIITGFIITAFFYQTNPAWHYGTTGYGPTRHIIFILPLFIFLSYRYLKQAPKHVFGFVFLALLALQGYSLFFNNFFYPDTTKTLAHTPYARYFLNNHPQLYNPTPEIFIDRTLGQDTMLPQSAIYKQQGICKKAYILPNNQFLLIQECGFIPKSEQDKLQKLESYSSYQGVYVAY